MPILTSTDLLSGTRVIDRQRPATDASPGQPGDELLGGILRDLLVRAQPVPGADLGHSDKSDAEQVRLGIAYASVFADELADHVGAVVDRLVHPPADGWLVAEIGLEDQPE